MVGSRVQVIFLLIATSAICVVFVSTLHAWADEATTRISLDEIPISSLALCQRFLNHTNIPLQEEQEQSPPKKEGGLQTHVVITTDCKPFQDWQAYVFFYHALKVGQKGKVTRVASGCKDTEKGAELTRFHEQHIKTMSPNFHIHLTQDYTFVKPGENYKYFNKAFGLRHWMEKGLHFPENKEHEDVIFIVLDPDQLLLRPFTTADFTNGTGIVWWKDSWASNKSQLHGNLVEHGSPIAQRWDLYIGYEWLPNIDMKKIAPQNEIPSRVNALSKQEAKKYAAGPPYIATGKDMYKIVAKWVDFAPYVYDVKPGHMTEMYAYQIAAAHLSLPHRLAQSFMAASIHVEETGWSLIDQFTDMEVCATDLPRDQLPHTLHYCHRSMLGKWFFNKYFMPTDIISCKQALMMEPPKNVASLYDFGITRDGRLAKYPNPKIRKRIAFSLCRLISAVNEAASFYKENHCDPGTINMNKSFIFHDNMVIKKNVSEYKVFTDGES